MSNSGLNTLSDLEEEFRILQAKLSALEQKKLDTLETEGAIRTDMQRIENQILRLKKAQEKTPQS